MTKPNEWGIAEASRALRTHDVSVRELFDVCHAAAVARNPELNAYRELFEPNNEALENAQKRLDTEGESAPLLCGIPLATKDNILIEGQIASASSKMLEHYRATYDATVVTRLKAAGALFLGRTNMDEFALGGSTENSAFGVTHNPHDPTRVAGGTSGGSAAAVAANLAVAALGTDTGGSVRNPASYTGVVGLKPTYGAVSRSGVIAAASSFDQVGPLTKSVADARLLFEVICGRDPLDSTTIATDTYPAHDPHVRTVGVPRALLEKGVDPDVLDRFEATLSALGLTVVDIDIPTIEPSLAAYYIINFAEVSTNLARYDGVRYGHHEEGANLLEDYLRSRTGGFGKEAIRRIMLGTFVLSSGYIDAYYRKATAARAALRHDYETAFASVDVIATPTMPTPAFVIGEKSDPLALYLEDVFTVLANLTGMPAISVPMGTVLRGEVSLPVGIHFTAPHASEERLFSIGEMVEKQRV